MFKFKIDPQDIEKTKAIIERKFKAVCNDPAMLAEQGRFLSERIRYQARITKPFNTSNGFPNLKPSTIANREYLAKHNRTDPTYSAARSNLTLTGAFFDSLGFVITGLGEFTLEFKGEHPGYKGAKGPIKRKSPLLNTTLAGYLREKGFDPYKVEALQTNRTVTSRLVAITKGYLRRALKLS